MPYIASLNALRFLGAAAVIATHLGSKSILDRNGLGRLYVLV